MHPQVRWIFKWQAKATALVLLVAGVTGGMHAAISALMGGAVGILSGMAYIWRATRGVGDAGRAYRGQVLGEAYKFAVTILLFALIFVGYREVAPLPLFVAYVLTFVVYWAALLKQS